MNPGPAISVFFTRPGGSSSAATSLVATSRGFCFQLLRECEGQVGGDVAVVGGFGAFELDVGVGRAEGRRGVGQRRAQRVVRLHLSEEPFLGFDSDFESDFGSGFASDFVSDFVSGFFSAGFSSTSFFSPARL